VHRAGEISRRAFLRGSAAAGVLAAGAVSLPRAVGAATRTPTSSQLTRGSYAALVGSTFRMTGGGDNLNVVLSAIDDLQPVARPGDPNRFALVFRTPASRARSAGGIRTLHNSRSGTTTTLFVSPVDRGVEAHWYEAVINRS
jgi:hypothetical protein